jgi:hypothetical protein
VDVVTFSTLTSTARDGVRFSTWSSASCVVSPRRIALAGRCRRLFHVKQDQIRPLGRAEGPFDPFQHHVPRETTDGIHGVVPHRPAHVAQSRAQSRRRSARRIRHGLIGSGAPRSCTRYPPRTFVRCPRSSRGRAESALKRLRRAASGVLAQSQHRDQDARARTRTARPEDFARKLRGSRRTTQHRLARTADGRGREVDRNLPQSTQPGREARDKPRQSPSEYACGIVDGHNDTSTVQIASESRSNRLLGSHSSPASAPEC